MAKPEIAKKRTMSADEVRARDVPRRRFVRVLGMIAGGAGLGVTACDLSMSRDTDTPNDRDRWIKDAPFRGGDVIFQDEDSSTDDLLHGDSSL